MNYTRCDCYDQACHGYGRSASGRCNSRAAHAFRELDQTKEQNRNYCRKCSPDSHRAESRQMVIDVHVSNHGSVFLFRPETDAARQWIDENVNPELWFGDAFACEPRYARDLTQGMIDSGLEVR